MAKIQLGSVATDIRGSVAGVTFSRNKGGAYSRARVAPINPRSPAQSAVRANFGSNSKVWSGTLTDAQRAAWTSFAAANPVTNVFGAAIILSGLAMLMRLNQVLAQLGVAPISDPPVDMSVPALAAVIGWSPSHTGPSFFINTDAQAVTAGAKYYVFATGQLAPGKKPGSSAYRFVGAYAAVAAAVTIDIYADWTLLFGDAQIGRMVGLQVATVNVATGALTPSLVFNSLIAV